MGIGLIAQDTGVVVTSVLAHIAQLEEMRVRGKTGAGIVLGRETYKATGKTHDEKLSPGRPKKINYSNVIKWRRTNNASIAETAKILA